MADPTNSTADFLLPGMRDPDEETEDYPSLVVHDGRVTGSITAGRSRLPLWAFVSTVVHRGWGDIAEEYPSASNVGADGLSGFLYDLLEARGDFARLLCVLADVERQEGDREDAIVEAHFAEAHPGSSSCDGCMPPEAHYGWWQHSDLRARVVDALTRCLDALEAKP